MLADVVEAACRTLSEPTPARVQKRVQELIMGLFNDGQLDQSTLTLKDLHAIRSRSYDLVVNGMEIGSGSIRIHERKLQELIFKTIGIGDDEARLRFGFLLDAFKYGAPPHGGVAFGLDRLMTLLMGCESIRDVIAFPKTQKAFCPMTNAPSPVDEKQLNELNIKIRK